MQTNQTFDKITNKQEIDPNAKVTQTETLADMIPEIKQKGFVKIGVVYSDRTKTNHGRFTFVGITAQGEMMPIESLENIVIYTGTHDILNPDVHRFQDMAKQKRSRNND